MYTVDNIHSLESFSKTCPFCKVELRKKKLVTVSTGCCFHCGQRVLEFPEQKSEPVDSSDEILQKSYDNSTLVWHLGYLLLFYLLWGASWGIVIIFVRNQIAWVNKNIVLDGPFLLLFAWIMIAANSRTKRSYHCQHCQFSMAKQFEPYLALTGRCPSCAQLIVKDLALPAEKVGTPRLEIETYLKELKATRKRLQSPANWASGWLVFMIILGLILVEYFIPPFRARLVNQIGADNAVFVILGMVFLWVLIMFGPFTREVIRLSKNLTKDNLDEPGINCPCCSKTIFNSDISIATKRCHHCREVVFAEPEKREEV